MTLTHLAMFSAANCIEPRYQGYGMQPEACAGRVRRRLR